MAGNTRNERGQEREDLAAAARDRGMEQLESAKGRWADSACHTSATVASWRSHTTCMISSCASERGGNRAGLDTTDLPVRPSLVLRQSLVLGWNGSIVTRSVSEAA